jgi:hypothetical protein
MSRSGKETLLKAIIQAIPTFIMSCFQIHVSICEALRKAIVDHWWGIEAGKKKMHWKSWDWLSTPKNLGGMGFRDLVLFNQAMLGRQCWKLLTEPTYLCARVLKGRYFPQCDVWDAPLPRSSSFTWRSICFGMQLVKQGARWSVGDGKRIKVLTDRWIPNVNPCTLRTLTPIPIGATVDCLLSDDHGSWDAEVVRAVFEEDVANRVLDIPISRRGGDDFISGPFTKYGVYSVRSAYHLAREEKFFINRSKQGGGAHSSLQDENLLWKKLWAIKAPGKMKINLWRFVHDYLPSGVQLCRRHIPASMACVVCVHRRRHLHIRSYSVSMPRKCGGR